MTRFETWSIAAVNLTEHADNPVHTVAGGLAAGFDGAVVAGTTIFAYLTRPIAQAWGPDWISRGGLEVWFRGPVLADERVVVSEDSAGITATVDSRVCAVLHPVLEADTPEPPGGKRLEPVGFELTDRWTGYAARAGEDLDLYRTHDLVHPSVWPCLANRIFARQLVDGPWVHTRSHITHLGVARPGATVIAEPFEIDRFTTRTGERAIVDIRFTIDDQPVARVEHEAIVRLS